jgi:hypothetical protein
VREIGGRGADTGRSNGVITDEKSDNGTDVLDTIQEESDEE